jgi:hypothetical protein
MITVQLALTQSDSLSQNNVEKSGGVARVAEILLSKLEALSSTPRTAKLRKKEERKRRKKREGERRRKKNCPLSQ